MTDNPAGGPGKKTVVHHIGACDATLGWRTLPAMMDFGERLVGRLASASG